MTVDEIVAEMNRYGFEREASMWKNAVERNQRNRDRMRGPDHHDGGKYSAATVWSEEVAEFVAKLPDMTPAFILGNGDGQHGAMNWAAAKIIVDGRGWARQREEAAAVVACTKATPCCDRVDEYNGFGSDGPTKFTCPRSCACHD